MNVQVVRPSSRKPLSSLNWAILGGIVILRAGKGDIGHSEGSRPAAGLPHRRAGIGRLGPLRVDLEQIGHFPFLPHLLRRGVRLDIGRLPAARGGNRRAVHSRASVGGKAEHRHQQQRHRDAGSNQRNQGTSLPKPSSSASPSGGSAPTAAAIRSSPPNRRPADGGSLVAIARQQLTLLFFLAKVLHGTSFPSPSGYRANGLSVPWGFLNSC